MADTSVSAVALPRASAKADASPVLPARGARLAALVSQMQSGNREAHHLLPVRGKRLLSHGGNVSFLSGYLADLKAAHQP